MSAANRRRRRAVAAFPDFVDVVAVAIRAGLSPSMAVIAAGRHTDPALRAASDAVIHRLERGERLADSLDPLVELMGDEAVSFVDLLGNADRYGYALEPVLDRLATDCRLSRQRIADRYARTLPVRLSFPLVLCTLPGFVLCAVAPALLGALSSLGDLAP